MSTYTPIASQILTGSASSVIFTGIPQGYTDIRVVVITAVNTATYMRFNSDTGNNYSLTEMWAGSSPNSERATNISRIDLRNSSSTLGNNMATLDINNYSNSVTYKTVLTEIRDGLYDRVYRQVQLWRNTAAITTITLLPDSGTFPAGSTFNIYGIAAGSAKAQGGIVTTDGTYWYHTFKNSGLFSTYQALTVDYLVIAGGGGGSAGQTNNSIGAGGGAGGLRSTVGTTGGGGSLESALSLTANTDYVITVGAGGAASVSIPNASAAPGTSSTFSTITSIAGGSGNSVSGGSGGGGRLGTGNTGGAGTANQGYAGGTGGAVSGAGGGGSGGTGQAGSGVQGGNGGTGVAISTLASATSTGVSNYYAGGGGGASDTGGGQPSGGAGGGGAGSAKNAGNATAGTIATGSGGGGGAAGDTANQFGANGGSGLVILRYAV